MGRYHADRVGELPSVDDVLIGGVRLPRGNTIVPSEEFAASVPTVHAVAWISADYVPDVGGLWCQLSDTFAHHGLWPLLLDSLDGDDARPWETGELDPALSSDPASHDASALLAEMWTACIPESEEVSAELAPCGRDFAGLAAPTSGPPIDIPDYMEGADGRLGLVATTRPADVPAIIGWTGPLNHEPDMGKLAAIMRSWEDRFGAYLIGLGFDTMSFIVERPPTTIEHALAIAAEHFAFCPDRVWQDKGSLHNLATSLLDAQLWFFWWD
jgi:hypothetical protein